MTDPLQANVAHFELTIDGVSDPLRIVQMNGRESLSQLFEFAIKLESDTLDVKPVDVVGNKAALTIMTPYGAVQQRTIRGVITRFEHVGVESTRHVADYVAYLGPDIYVLKHNAQCRIFQEMTAPDILKEVLESAGIPGDSFRIDCSGGYDPLEYCVQYRESDFNFFNRLAERFGIFYFFEFTDTETTLVIGDNPNVHPSISGDTIAFNAAGGPMVLEDHVFQLSLRYSLRSHTYTLRDYNFKSPDMDLTQQDTSEASNELEWYDYPGYYRTQRTGGDAARIKREADDCLRNLGSGKSTSVRPVPGLVATVTGHPVQDHNEAYLITAVTHVGGQPAPDSHTADEVGYHNEFAMQPAAQPFRPAPVTPKPLVHGGQTATVTGPGGEEIFCDEHGRIKVRFHWDRADTPDDKSSCWVRVANLWAGKGWGGVFIPRIGQEVVVSFLEGDPDQPLVTGCVYNGLNILPYPLPDNQTMSTIKSESSIGGDGFNEFRFEDKKGEEQVFLHSQKDLVIQTLNCKSQTTGNDETLEIGNNRTKTVKKDETTTVEGNRTETVHLDEKINIKQNRTVEIDNGDDKLEVKTGNHIIDVNTGDQTTTIKTGNRKTDINTGNDELTIKTGSRVTKINAKNDELEILTGDRSVKINAGDDTLEIASGKREVKAKSKYSLETKEAEISTDKKTTLKTGSTSQTIEGTSIKLDSTKISIAGKTEIELKVGGNSIKLGAAGIDIKAAGILTLKGSLVKIN